MRHGSRLHVRRVGIRGCHDEALTEPAAGESAFIVAGAAPILVEKNVEQLSPIRGERRRNGGAEVSLNARRPWMKLSMASARTRGCLAEKN